jgi:hypothetical protein
MPYSRGNVVLVLFPDSNLRTAKRRPALVVQADNLQTGLSQPSRHETSAPSLTDWLPPYVSALVR